MIQYLFVKVDVVRDHAHQIAVLQARQALNLHEKPSM